MSILTLFLEGFSFSEERAIGVCSAPTARVVTKYEKLQKRVNLAIANVLS